jgi:prolyl-tRNA editing enzyme YbaK/EbsC (Cys-tRNA(Pro) deacylase)
MGRGEGANGGHASVLEAVGRLGVPYEVVACDPECSDTEAFGAHYGYPLERIVNTIVVRSRSGPPSYASCVLLGSTRLDVNGVVRRRMGVRKVSFAPPEEASALTGMPPGGVSPFGLPEGLAIWIDPRVLAGSERLIIGSGERASKLLVVPYVLAAIPGAEAVEGLAAERGVG